MLDRVKHLIQRLITGIVQIGRRLGLPGHGLHGLLEVVALERLSDVLTVFKVVLFLALILFLVLHEFLLKPFFFDEFSPQ